MAGGALGEPSSCAVLTMRLLEESVMALLGHVARRGSCSQIWVSIREKRAPQITDPLGCVGLVLNALCFPQGSGQPLPAHGKPLGAPACGKPLGAPACGKPLGAPACGKPLGAPASGKPLGAPVCGKPLGAPAARRGWQAAAEGDEPPGTLASYTPCTPEPPVGRALG